MPIVWEGPYLKISFIDADSYPRVKSAGPHCHDFHPSCPRGVEPPNKGHHGTWEGSLQSRSGTVGWVGLMDSLV
jgi:hypothetical protein